MLRRVQCGETLLCPHTLAHLAQFYLHTHLQRTLASCLTSSPPTSLLFAVHLKSIPCQRITAITRIAHCTNSPILASLQGDKVAGYQTWKNTVSGQITFTSPRWWTFTTLIFIMTLSHFYMQEYILQTHFTEQIWSQIDWCLMESYFLQAHCCVLFLSDLGWEIWKIDTEIPILMTGMVVATFSLWT